MLRIAAQKTARALTPNAPARRSSRRPRTLLVEALEARQLLDVGGFTAFNDLLAGPGTHANTTTYDANPSSGDAASGPLRRIDNGANTTATLTVSQSGSIAFGTTTDNPEPGTDAYEAFNGFVDFGNGGAQSIE